MLETLTILPMAPGTRSRRAEGLHRAPMLLSKQKPPKPKPQQAVQPPPAQPPKPAHLPPHSSPKHALQPPKSAAPSPISSPNHFTIAAPTRSLQNILNHADSVRSKRKSDLAGASDTGNAGVDIDAADAATRKRPRLSVEILTRPSSAGTGTKPAVGGSATASTAPTAAQPAQAAPLSKKALRGAVSAPTNTANHAVTPADPAGSSTATTTSAAATTASSPANSSSQPATRPKPTKHSARTTSQSAQITKTTTQTAPTITITPSAEPAQPDSKQDSNKRPPRSAGRPPSKRAAQPPQASQLAHKPKDKAVNGIKQELKNLHVTPEAVAAAAGPPEGGRKLRSQEASRFKSELSAYFPDYDEVIGNDPKEEHILNIDTPILLVESSTHHPTAPPHVITATPLTFSGASASPAFGSRGGLHSTRARASHTALPVRHPNHTTFPVRAYGDSLFYELSDSHVLDFSFLGTQHNGRHTDDPLPDTYFELHHKRAERLERSIRNSEKGRAQHERDQIIRLLEGLQGPDWLRIMGVSGITESKKKTFEPARDHFIRGCRSILEKFRLWSLEEKRRKIEKDKVHAEEVKARQAADQPAASTARPRGRGKAKATTAAASRAAAAAAEKAADKAAEKSAKAAKVRSRSRRHSDHVEDSEAPDDDDEAEEKEEEADDDEDDGADAEAQEEEQDEDDDSQLDSSDVDAVIAKQLRAEALARSRFTSRAAPKKATRRSSKTTSKATSKTASKTTSKAATKTTNKKTAKTTVDSANKRRKLKHDSHAADACQKPDTEAPASSKRVSSAASQKKITSFFEKHQEREAAMTRSRRKGRKAEADLSLPEGAVGEVPSKSQAAGRKRPATRGSRKS